MPVYKTTWATIEIHIILQFRVGKFSGVRDREGIKEKRKALYKINIT